jgi:TonB family protein
MLLPKRFICSFTLLLLAASCLPADQPMRVSGTEAQKAAIQKVSPVYPETARQLRITGKIELEAIVGTDGNVEEAKAVSGNALLTRAGVEALKKWRFTPFTADGKATRAVVSVNFDFHL